MNEQTRTYLDLYSRLEKAIRDKYPVPDGDGAVAWLARNERGYRGIANELDYCREVRNLLQHNELVNDDYAVVPSAGMMECLRDALSRVLDVPTAGGICVKTQQLYAAGIHDRIRPAMRAMVQNAYAYVPILEDGRVQGVMDGLTVYAPADADILPGDRIRFGGNVYTITGDPLMWPGAARLAHMQLNLQRWRG